MAVKVIGLDTAKHVLQVHGADESGRTVVRKRLRRAQISGFFANLPKCVVGIEATQGAHYWARLIGSFGHEIRLIAPQFVKPYLKGQKNDARDAAAICEAISRPEMRFVPQKSIAQQDLQALHRIRSRLIGSRTQLGNQIRGLLAEYGIILALHLSEVRKQLPELFSEDHPLLTSFSREFFASLYEVSAYRVLPRGTQYYLRCAVISIPALPPLWPRSSAPWRQPASSIPARVSRAVISNMKCTREIIMLEEAELHMVAAHDCTRIVSLTI